MLTHGANNIIDIIGIIALKPARTASQLVTAVATSMDRYTATRFHLWVGIG